LTEDCFLEVCRHNADHDGIGKMSLFLKSIKMKNAVQLFDNDE